MNERTQQKQKQKQLTNSYSGILLDLSAGVRLNLEREGHEQNNGCLALPGRPLLHTQRQRPCLDITSRLERRTMGVPSMNDETRPSVRPDLSAGVRHDLERGRPA